MKKYTFIVMAILLNSNISNAQDICKELRPCASENISKLDDGISSAAMIAGAVMSSCPRETEQCVQEMQENAVKLIPDQLKADGTFDKATAGDIADIERRVRSDKSSRSFRETIKNEMLTPMVLRYRASNIKN